jgi:hypothetical protein
MPRADAGPYIFLNLQVILCTFGGAIVVFVKKLVNESLACVFFLS